ncbi:type II secretion system F family protein [Cellulomonas xylanilytica]|uniref:Type II secretion system protein n=1 Tax=Cellulomonas xylanilytica TaxID=233583 RepID=A0A510VA93_9CELL|nr:type II secretion system F family protein [Cellulomonas xylanilytica]GEK22901.1 type II secretion system protein [Cellulomonas xylanilytica]
MSPSTLFIVLLGGLVGVGVVVLLVAMRPRPEEHGVVKHGGPSLVQRIGRRGLLAAGVALVVLLITQWPVAALGAAAVVLSWDSLFGGARAERQAMARIEGLASWTESLRDTIAGAVGLEQAIPATVYASSPAIQPQLRLLVDRLRVRVPLPTALQRLADDLDDPSADLIVASLILNARLRGPGLRQVLTSLSESARAELDMRQRVAAGRSSTRRSAQIVMLFSLGVILLISIASPDYVAPYSSPTGQLVLFIVIGLFGAGFWWMKRLSGVDVPERFLVATPERMAMSTPTRTPDRAPAPAPGTIATAPLSPPASALRPSTEKPL